MKFKFIGCLVAIIWMGLFIYAQEPVDIESIIKEVKIDRQEGALSGYSYKMDFIRKKKTILRTSKLVKRYKVILPSRFPKNQVYKHSLLLVYDSTKNVTAKDIISSRNKIIRELEKIENKTVSSKTQKKIKKTNGGYITLRAGKKLVGKHSLSIDLLKLIENSTFSNLKEINVNGRETVSIDFQSLPDKKFADNFFYLGHIEGKVLIDKEDKRIIEVKAFPKGKSEQYLKLPAAEQEQFKVFHYQQIRVPEGFWFPQKVTLNFMENSEEYRDLNVKVEFIFTEYRRFVTGVESYTPEPAEQENNIIEAGKVKKN